MLKYEISLCGLREAVSDFTQLIRTYV